MALILEAQCAALRFAELWEDESDLGGGERTGSGGKEGFEAGIGEEPSAELGPGREGQEFREVTLSQSGTVEWRGMKIVIVVHKQKRI